jgi:hypothetical protein
VKCRGQMHLPWLPPAPLGSPSTSHLGLQDLVPLWGQIVHDTREGSFQGHSTDKQDGQHHVGESGREVHHLGRESSMDKSAPFPTLASPL